MGGKGRVRNLGEALNAIICRKNTGGGNWRRDNKTLESREKGSEQKEWFVRKS